MLAGRGGAIQGRSVLIEDARHRFYSIIEEQTSYVLEALLYTPLGAYKKLIEVVPKEWMTWASMESGETAEHAHVRRELETWGTTYKLNAPWIYDDVLFTFRTWEKRDPYSHKYKLYQGDSTTKEIRDKHLRFARVNAGGIEPQVPIFSFKSSTLEEFDEEVRKHRKRISKGWTQESDEPEVPLRFSLVNEPEAFIFEKAQKAETLNRYLEWLVWYQIRGFSRDEIAKTLDEWSKSHIYDPSHIGNSIKAAAELIGLPLRKDTGGRPRKPVT